MVDYRKITLEAIEIGKYILEGHNYDETADEFSTSRDTVKRRVRSLEIISPKMYDLIVSKYPNRARKS